MSLPETSPQIPTHIVLEVIKLDRAVKVNACIVDLSKRQFAKALSMTLQRILTKTDVKFGLERLQSVHEDESSDDWLTKSI